jgi:hypothetical protein
MRGARGGLSCDSDPSRLRQYEGGERISTRQLGSVTLLIRVIATAIRAGVDKLLVIWPRDIDRSIGRQCAACPLPRGLQIAHLVRRSPYPLKWLADVEASDAGHDFDTETLPLWPRRCFHPSHLRI